jgi:hypothetical protein
MGVVSKKLTGARRTDATRFWCTFWDAVKRCAATQSERHVKPSTPAKLKKAYLRGRNKGQRRSGRGS